MDPHGNSKQAHPHVNHGRLQQGWNEMLGYNQDVEPHTDYNTAAPTGGSKKKRRRRRRKKGWQRCLLLFFLTCKLRLFTQLKPIFCRLHI